MATLFLTLALLLASLGNALSNNRRAPRNSPMVVVFGRPGAGKTTVADCAMEQLRLEQPQPQPQKRAGNSSTSTSTSTSTGTLRMVPVGLDLDVCVPQWMRDNFAMGIYPTTEQRQAFACECCDYVDQRLWQASQDSTTDNRSSSCQAVPVAGVVSFSFVNTDLREVFRSRFPKATWILIDTTEMESKRRLEQREGHFYKGKLSDEPAEEQVAVESPPTASKQDNSDWDFAPVTFDHVVLDGDAPLESNGAKVAKILTRGLDLN